MNQQLNLERERFPLQPGQYYDFRSGYREIHLGPLTFISMDFSTMMATGEETVVEVKGVAHLRKRDLQNDEEALAVVTHWYPNLTDDDELTAIFYIVA